MKKIKRRDFIKSGLLSAASLSAIGPLVLSQGSGPYIENQQLSLANEYLDWRFLMTGGAVKSAGIRNKLSGRSYELNVSNELLLTFSQAKVRVEIPWWNYQRGADNDSTPPPQEQGFVSGYHLQEFSGDANWEKVANLSTLHFGTLREPWAFNGYAWFRQFIELPKEAEEETIVFCLGGYNQEDWNEYWLYVNGILCGNWTGAGRWRKPKELVVRPGSVEHQALKFGSGEKNLVAIRTWQFDRRFEGVSSEILDRFVFDGRLVDQFVAVGQPYRHLSDFKLDSWRREGGIQRPHLLFKFNNINERLELALHYELDGFVRRKWCEVKNVGKQERLLLDVDLDDFSAGVPVTEGDYGFPVIVGNEIFCAVEHPGGLNQGMGERVRLRHFPGKKLPAGTAFRSHVSIVGVGAKGGGRQQFVDYIQANSPRKNLLSIYDPLGVNGFPDEPCWTLNDDEMLATLDLLEKWQKQGVKFDYYVPDVGWQDWGGDLTRFWPNCFPEGPQKVIKRVNELGMKWGLWFAGTFADWSSGLNPKMEPSRTLINGGEWPKNLYRDGFDISDWSRQLCLASEPYFDVLRNALLYHIHHYNLRLFKLDGSSFYCNSTEHGHLPGKYSTEANYDAVIEIARVTRQACPDLYIMWYGGPRSPFFALHGDSVFDKRLTMEGASTGDSPALFFRDAVSLAQDQAARFAEFIPPMNSDSLGVWITDTSWGNSMRKERWREALIMDMGRGSLLFPQIWGDLRMFSDEDVAFLARYQQLAKQSETIFYNRQNILGDPLKDEIYGYSYFQGAHGFLFMNNVHFESRPVRLQLDETVGLKVPANTRLRLRAHFPHEAALLVRGQDEFASGQIIETWLRPFEVAMWELMPEGRESTPKGFGQRELPMEKPDIGSQRVALESEPVGPDREIYFSDPPTNFRSPVTRPTLKELERNGFGKRIIARRGSLPLLGSTPCFLAILLRLREKDGKWWRHNQLADLMQIKATINEETIRFEAVPNFRQSSSYQWCPWLVFRTRMSHAWSGKDMRLAITAYLPPDVEIQTEGWVVAQWWTE